VNGLIINFLGFTLEVNSLVCFWFVVSVSLSVATERGCCWVAEIFSIKILFYLVLHKVTSNHRQLLDSQIL